MKKIAVAKGEGIGPEIMDAVLEIMHHAGAQLEVQMVNMGKQWYEKGFSTGMTPESKEMVESCGILFKGPMETPKGGGMKSINVTARKVWSTYANKRVFKSLPGVKTIFSEAGIPIDITIVRENIEDTYGGIEHMLTHDVALCRRFITRPGSMQVHRYTFEMARKKNAKKVTCGHKANIMKITDGLFLECFYEVAKEYPEIKADDVIVDDLAMKLVVKPNEFDIIVLPNLQGDIISDLCAGLVGGLGFAPSANIGDQISIFEAVHGTAPDITGQNKANPTSLLLSGAMLLRHIGQNAAAENIENALIKTLQDGIHTPDLNKNEGLVVGTKEFAAAIIQRLSDSKPYANNETHSIPSHAKPTENLMMETKFNGTAEIVGVDLFIESYKIPVQVGQIFEDAIDHQLWKLVTISNRGTQVYPTGSIYTECINQYRVRIECATKHGTCSQNEILELVTKLSPLFKLCSIEMLMSYNGKKAYSLAQGQ